jgi:dTDP-4-amino-4,6-dideoxygalactose transaminase
MEIHILRGGLELERVVSQRSHAPAGRAGDRDEARHAFRAPAGFYAKKYGYRPADFAHAALCEDTTITLPIFPGMTDAEQDKVVDVLAEALRG